MSAGKKITFAPSEKENEKLLKKAAREGFYYPALAIKQLNSLSSGAFGKNNVYIPNANDSRAHTMQELYMYLPGIRATIENRHNTGYVVSLLELSEGYKGIGKGDDKPGIYSVLQTRRGLTTEFRKNGQPKAEDNRYVVICESGYENSIDAAKDLTSRLEKVTNADVARDCDYDIMFSGSNLNGMKAFKPMGITGGYASASILANAMTKSKNRKVNWASDGGGSVVLTQAMAIAGQQNLKLTNHSARMFQPSSDSTTAYRLAQQIGFKLGNNFSTGSSSRGFGVLGKLANVRTKALRLGNQNDSFSLKEGGNKLIESGMGGVGIAGASLLGASLLMTQTPAMMAAGTTLGSISAVHLIWTKAKNFAANRRKK